MNDFVLTSSYLNSNMNPRYGPDYNVRCLFGQDRVAFGRFYPRLNLNIT
jgi:hypothetical protein